MSNRLAHETSPYLLQHKDNPVDWFPWGDEALARARTEDVPILLSVGYSACHWCHVMEHESFADPEVARLMNERFVNIKVDREERPDIDSLYMQAVQQMTGHGGWPMTVFLTPDGSPFYGGTYFPPEPRHGLPSFRQILAAVSDAYRERRADVDRSAAELRDALAKGMGVNPGEGSPDDSMLQLAFHRIASRFDPRWGGFGGAPKFPQPMTLDFLLGHAWRTGTGDALLMVERTLAAMAAGGIYDHLGGGFHRYAVDSRWLVPHFEKMLYDNALLSGVYLRAYQVMRRPDFGAVAVEVLDYVLREMRAPSGGFYSSQDADSEGEEGRFYVWSTADIDAVLDPEDSPLFQAFYDVSEAGNWEGNNILNAPRPFPEVAAEAGVSAQRLKEAVERGKRALYEARSRRVWPGRDEKVLTSWNAMMLASFAQAARLFEQPRYLDACLANAEFLVTQLRREGRLLRTWRDGVAKIDGFLEDHALLAQALLEVYATTHDARWVREARWVADRMIERFWSPEEGVFYDTAADGPSLVIRPRDLYDNATPSGTSAAVSALLRLARLTGEPEYERVGGQVLSSMGEIASQMPPAFSHLLSGLALHLTPPSEVAIVGRRDAEDTRDLLRVRDAMYLPYTTMAFKSPEDEETGNEIPLLAERPAVGGRATAYVCRSYVCDQPVTEPAELQIQLEALGAAVG